MLAAENAGYPASDLGMYIQPVVQGTGYHCEFNLFYDPANLATKSHQDLVHSSYQKLDGDRCVFLKTLWRKRGDDSE